MAQIRRIGHDHQTPFWHVVVVLLLLLVEVSSGDAKQKQAATCTIHLGPIYFYRFWTPYIKMPISATNVGLIKCAPKPSDPPYGGGGQNIFLVVMTDPNRIKFSKHRPSGPMLSISRFVRLSVCPSVRLSVCSLLRYRLNVFFPPLPKVGCPIFLEIRNPWGKVMERSGLIFEHCCLKMV